MWCYITKIYYDFQATAINIFQDLLWRFENLSILRLDTNLYVPPHHLFSLSRFLQTVEIKVIYSVISYCCHYIWYFMLISSIEHILNILTWFSRDGTDQVHKVTEYTFSLDMIEEGKSSSEASGAERIWKNCKQHSSALSIQSFCAILCCYQLENINAMSYFCPWY